MKRKKKKKQDSLYNLKETVVRTGQGEQLVIVPNKAIDPTFDSSVTPHS